MKSILIGYGYWGKIITKYIRQSVLFELVGICDPHLNGSLELEDILDAGVAECAFVCVRVSAHYETVYKLLANGIHVFCEKPLCRTLTGTLELYALARQERKALYTDYIYTVSPSVKYIKCHMDILGDIKYISMDICQFGKFYEGESVYGVIGVHMVSALVYLFEAEENEIEVLGVETAVRNGIGDAEAGTIYFSIRGIKGKIECSLISNVKRRRFEIICQRGILVFDMMQKDTVQVVIHQGDGVQKRQEVVCKEQFDEKNNLNFALEGFYNATQAGDAGNEEVALRVAEILEQVQKIEGHV